MLIDNGTHSVDIMRYFLGPVAEVQVVEGKRIQGLAVEDTVRIFVRAVAASWATSTCPGASTRSWRATSTSTAPHGTVSVGWQESKYRQSAGRDWVVFGKGYNKVQAFAAQIDNFAGAIRGEEALLITAEDALASVEVIEAAYADLRRSHWVRVGEKPADGASTGPAA